MFFVSSRPWSLRILHGVTDALRTALFWTEISDVGPGISWSHVPCLGSISPGAPTTTGTRSSLSAVPAHGISLQTNPPFNTHRQLVVDQTNKVLSSAPSQQWHIITGASQRVSVHAPFPAVWCFTELMWLLYHQNLYLTLTFACSFTAQTLSFPRIPAEVKNMLSLSVIHPSTWVCVWAFCCSSLWLSEALGCCCQDGAVVVTLLLPWFCA